MKKQMPGQTKKRIRYYTMVWIVFMILSFGCAQKMDNADAQIHLNSIGYLTEGSKKATIIGSSGKFKVIDVSTGKKVFKSKTEGPVSQGDVQQTAYIADFSELTDEGTYYIELPGGAKSAEFQISDAVYDDAFYTVTRAFYLWRCGTAVEGVHQGDTFSQEICHTDDAWLDFTEFGKKHKDGTGGWHDAGDHGKYVVNAGITVGLMFLAWDHFQSNLENKSFDIPATAPDYPDFLAEIKWETDWLLKMAYPDQSGRVSHKLTRLNFSGFIMPHEDDAKRYFTEWGSTATAQFTAIMAQAARYFEPVDPSYAQQCLKAATNSYEFLSKNPDYKKWEQDTFKTGGYQSPDSSARAWAAVELWETTGKQEYLDDFESRITGFDQYVDDNWDWNNVKNMGVFTYVASQKSGKDEAVAQAVQQSLIDVADSIVQHAEKDIYGRPSDAYFWGCNGLVTRLSANLYMAWQLTGNEKYKATAQDILSHVFGRNYYGRSFVTGLGIDPPMHPHDRRSGADNVAAPWPGYIVGGGHTATDWVDVEESYSHNEVAINWQASLVYAMAWFTD